jgi:hypothetical protein
MNPTHLNPWYLFFLTLSVLPINGCATMGDRGQPLVPTQYQTKTGPYVVYTNYPLSADDGVIKQLATLRSEVEETLGLRVDAGDHPIEVYILSDRKSFEHFLTFYYPELPQRRAFFIAQGDRRVVYTFKGERLDEDIRHEATHALLNLAIGDIPLWLDEGLAEYFEASGPTGLNREHLDRLPLDIQEGWSPSLDRLEGLKSVRQMSPRDYREAWSWVHFFLKDSGENRAALLGYLGDLRKHEGDSPPPRKLPSPKGREATALLRHLEMIRRGEPTRTANDEPTLRLQDIPIDFEPINPTPKRRSFFNRLLGRSGP